MVGRTIVGLGRIGKRVIVELDTNDRIVLEPRMTGLVLLAEPPNEEHLRLRIHLSRGAPEQLLFWDRRGLGIARLVDPDEFAELYGPDRIGPDALDATAELLRDRLAASRRAIKVALLDQRAVAGIGNLYASEMLHLAGIDPRRGCDRLKPHKWEALATANREVLELAIRYEGSTLADGTYRNALNMAGGYQNKHRVYDKTGETCRRCRQGVIVRIVQAQRSTFFCPICQPRARQRKAARAGIAKSSKI